VPTEKEIIENGNELGKTDAILLQKVEEIVLYLLQLKADNESLRAEMELLKNN
jgi:trimeric autotransporter adhesin